MTDLAAYRAERNLSQALIANFVLHGVAMLAMAALLLPGMPGGGAGSELLRVGYIANHPWLFRLGWFPWQLCALSDLWLAVALCRARFVPRLGAVSVVVLTLCAVVPDQGGQALWVTQGIALARTAIATGDLTAYQRFEARVFPWTAGWGAVFYTLAGLGWTWCFVKARTWTRLLTVISLILWPVMLVIAPTPLLPVGLRPSPRLVAAGNALAFTLLQVWLALVTEAVLRRAQPFLPHGRAARWRHFSPSLLGRVADLIANSRLVAALIRPLPVLQMVSDVKDVIYVNYLIPVARLVPLVPEGLELQRLGADGAYGLFTFLTFRHGHFGPRFLGPLRRFLPSPIQSNWRIHVRDPRSGILGIYFVTNATTSTLHGLLARILAEGMPMHVLRSAELQRTAQGDVQLRLDPGAGSAPAAEASLQPCATPALAPPFAACFASFADFLAYCVPQDRAMSTQLDRRTVTRHEIDLGIPLQVCAPLLGVVRSATVQSLVGDATPLCFVVPSLRFHLAREATDPLA